MDEDWAYIEGFPEYAVSNHGRVVNLKYDRVLKTQLTDRGYMKVMLQVDYTSHQFYVHRLVAAAFIKDFRDGLRVGHKDDDRANNHASNLWLRRGELDSELAYFASPRLNGRKLRIIETGEVFRTAYDCARRIGGRASNIYRVLNGYRSSHMGFTFEYVDVEATHLDRLAFIPRQKTRE